MKIYYSLDTNTTNEANIYIFGDIVSWECIESDVSSYTLAKLIQGLEVDHINVHINSYGGEVAEGLAIYNSLKNHKAKVKTICDGFACSAASIVFMAGKERVMNAASLLMIHNAWTYAAGNADELRKVADDMEKISDTAANAYREAGLAISDEKLTALLDAETWITPQEALEWGLATTIKNAQTADKAAASAQKAAYNLLLAGKTAIAQAIDELNPPPGETQKAQTRSKTGAVLNALSKITHK